MCKYFKLRSYLYDVGFNFIVEIKPFLYKKLYFKY